MKMKPGGQTFFRALAGTYGPPVSPIQASRTQHNKPYVYVLLIYR